MIQSEVAAELPLHMAVLACGSLGYAASKWADKKFIQPRIVGSGKKILFDEAGEEETAPASTNNTDVKEPTSVPKQTKETASEPVQAASSGKADAVPSQRVAKMLAKKAERKAKKAEQRLLDVAAPTTSPQQSPEDDVEKLEINDESCDNVTKAADEALGKDVANEVVESAGESEVSQPQSLKLALDSDTVAELSTADETSPLAWADQEPSSEDEFFFAGMAAQSEADDEVFAEEEPTPQYQSWPTASWNYEPHSNYREQAGDEAWMMPFEEIMRTPEDAAQWYSLGMAPMSGMDVQPVRAADGRQLYTDGEQYFVLACVDASEGQEAALQLVNPVVDPSDPVHGAFLEAVSGSQPASRPQRYDAGCSTAEGWNRPWAY